MSREVSEDEFDRAFAGGQKIDEAAIDRAVAALSGPAAGAERTVSEDEFDRAFSGGGDSPMVVLFKEAGLSQESAQRAARGLEEGRYFSFADAALAQTSLDGANGRPRKNRGATPERIRVVAEALEKHQESPDGGGATFVDGKRVS